MTLYNVIIPRSRSGKVDIETHESCLKKIANMFRALACNSHKDMCWIPDSVQDMVKVTSSYIYIHIVQDLNNHVFII